MKKTTLTNDTLKKSLDSPQQNLRTAMSTCTLTNNRCLDFRLNRLNLNEKYGSPQTLWQRGKSSCITPCSDNIKSINSFKKIFNQERVNSIKLCLSNIMNSDISEEELKDDIEEKLFKHFINKTLTGWDDYGIHYWLSNINDNRPGYMINKGEIPSPLSSWLCIRTCKMCLEQFNRECNFYSPSRLPVLDKITTNSYQCYNTLIIEENKMPLPCKSTCCQKIIETMTEEYEGKWLELANRSPDGEEGVNNYSAMKCSEQYFRRVVYSYNSCGLHYKFPEENRRNSIKKKKKLKRPELNPFMKVIVYGTDPCGLNFPVELQKSEEGFGDFNQSSNTDLANNNNFTYNSYSNFHTAGSTSNDSTELTDALSSTNSLYRTSSGDYNRSSLSENTSSDAGSLTNYFSVNESLSEAFSEPVEIHQAVNINCKISLNDEENFCNGMGDKSTNTSQKKLKRDVSNTSVETFQSLNINRDVSLNDKDKYDNSIMNNLTNISKSKLNKEVFNKSIETFQTKVNLDDEENFYDCNRHRSTRISPTELNKEFLDRTVETFLPLNNGENFYNCSTEDKSSDISETEPNQKVLNKLVQTYKSLNLGSSKKFKKGKDNISGFKYLGSMYNKNKTLNNYSAVKSTSDENISLNDTINEPLANTELLRTSTSNVSMSNFKYLPKLPIKFKRIYHTCYPYNGKILEFSVYDTKFPCTKQNFPLYYRGRKEIKKKKRRSLYLEFPSFIDMELRSSTSESNSTNSLLERLTTYSDLNEGIEEEPRSHMPVILQILMYVLFLIFFVTALLLVEDTMHFAYSFRNPRVVRKHHVFGLFG